MPYSHCLTLEIEYEAQLLDQWIMCAILSVSTYMLTFVDSEGQAFLLIYSITSKSSFDRIDIYRQAVLRVKGPKPIIALVGNKSDKTAEGGLKRRWRSFGEIIWLHFRGDVGDDSTERGAHIHLSGSEHAGYQYAGYQALRREEEEAAAQVPHFLKCLLFRFDTFLLLSIFSFTVTPQASCIQLVRCKLNYFPMYICICLFYPFHYTVLCAVWVMWNGNDRTGRKINRR